MRILFLAVNQHPLFFTLPQTETNLCLPHRHITILAAKPRRISRTWRSRQHWMASIARVFFSTDQYQSAKPTAHRNPHLKNCVGICKKPQLTTPLPSSYVPINSAIAAITQCLVTGRICRCTTTIPALLKAWAADFTGCPTHRQTARALRFAGGELEPQVKRWDVEYALFDLLRNDTRAVDEHYLNWHARITRETIIVDFYQFIGLRYAVHHCYGKSATRGELGWANLQWKSANTLSNALHLNSKRQ